MANEFKHGSVGTELTQAEWEGVGTHVVANQAVGDIVYADTTAQLLRLEIGDANDVLTVSSGKPAWAAPAAAAAGSLTGATLASGVTASSLTSVGTLTGLTLSGDINLQSNDLLNIGNSGSDWQANTLIVSGGAGVYTSITAETSVTNASAEVVAQGAAASTHPFGFLLRQGTGAGSADNQAYYLSYWGSGPYFRFRSTDTNGSSLDADIWRVNDGGNQMTLNVDHATGFDYVCEACGRSSGDEFICHGVQAPWHDDVALMTQATGRDVDNMPAAARDHLERLGLLTVDRRELLDGKPQHFMSLNRMPWFLMSGIAQNRWRLDAQHEAMDARLQRIEQALGV